MSIHPAFQTEIEFELPKGYVDGDGTLHRSGVDAPGHGGRRDPAAARPARAAERGLSHGHRAGARDHAARFARGRPHRRDRGAVRLRPRLPAAPLRATSTPAATPRRTGARKANGADAGGLRRMAALGEA